MKTLTPTSLREQAAQVIRASILANELEAGEIYSATVLAQRLGVSPTPVLEAMESVVEAIEERADAADVAGFLVADREFHLGLLEVLGNRRLVRLVAQLRDQTRLAGISELAREGNLTASAREHRDILDALRARDPDAAERLMRRHLVLTRGIWAGRSE